MHVSLLGGGISPRADYTIQQFWGRNLDELFGLGTDFP